MRERCYPWFPDVSYAWCRSDVIFPRQQCAKTVRYCNAENFSFRRLIDDLVGERSRCDGDQGS